MYAFPGDRSIASLWRAFFFGKLAISPPQGSQDRHDPIV
jgi:hypothetical protein